MSETSTLAARRATGLAHYDELARLGQAFGSPVRLRLLDLLRQAPRSVEALSSQAGLSVANVSQHLQQLRAAHIVTAERDGQRIVYRLSTPLVSSFFVALRTFGETLLPELDRIRAELRMGAAEITLDELLDKLERGQAVILDVRPAEEFRHAHWEGAISIPLQELRSRLSELPRDKTVVATCRGPYCPLAVEAVAILSRAGFDAVHVDLDRTRASRARKKAPPGPKRRAATPRKRSRS
jgi:DNA-binding transcriptional ArsR family regulator